MNAGRGGDRASRCRPQEMPQEMDAKIIRIRPKDREAETPTKLN